MNRCFKYFFIFLFLAVFSTQSTAYTSKKDSLLNELTKVNHDTTTAKLYYKLGLIFEKENNFDSIFYSFHKCLGISQKANFNRLVSYACNNLGFNLIQTGEIDSALFYLNKALPLMQNVENLKFNDLLNSLGNAYFLKGNYLKSYEYFLKYLKKIEKKGSDYQLARANSNVGVTLKELKKYDDALVFFNKSLQLAFKANNPRNKYVAYINIGNVYSEKSNNGKIVYNANEALENYNKAKDILISSTEPDDLRNMVILFGNIGNIYADLKQYEKAILEYNQAIQLLDKLDNFSQAALIYNNLAAVYIDMDNKKEAEKYLKLGYESTLNSDSPDDFLNNYKSYARFYELTGNYKKAYFYQVRVKVLSDSLFSTENAEKRKELELNLEYEKRQAEARAELDKKEAIAKEEKQRQLILRNVFIAGFALMLLVAFLIFRSYRLKQKHNEIILQQKLEVEKQKELVEEKQKEILDSIHYAKRIQQSLLPTKKYIEKSLKRLHE